MNKRRSFISIVFLLIGFVLFSTSSFADLQNISTKDDNFKNTLSQVIAGEKTPEALTDRIIVKEYDEYGNFTYKSISKSDHNRMKTSSIYEHSNIEYIQPDFIRYASYNVGETRSLSWGKDRIGSQNLIDKLGETINQVIVAVLDTGIDYNHELLKDRIVRGYNFIENNDNPMDNNSHGTHVAGIIVDSTNYNVKIMPVKVLDDEGIGYDSTIAKGIIYAVDNGAHIINMSLGGPGYSKHMAEAIQYALSRDVLVVVAAGNEGSNTKDFYPGSEKAALVVSATDKNDNFASFSNFGESVDIAAPGVNIYSSIPYNDYESYSGTSTAAPYITAIAALIKQEDLKRNVDTLEEILKLYTDDRGLPGKDDYFGEGIINVSNYLITDNVPPIETEYILLDRQVDVPLKKEWTILFNRSFKLEEIIDIRLMKGNDEIQIDIDYSYDEEKALIKSEQPYESGTGYYILIELKNGISYKMEFKTLN